MIWHLLSVISCAVVMALISILSISITFSIHCCRIFLEGFIYIMFMCDELCQWWAVSVKSCSFCENLKAIKGSLITHAEATCLFCGNTKHLEQPHCPALLTPQLWVLTLLLQTLRTQGAQASLNSGEVAGEQQEGHKALPLPAPDPSVRVQTSHSVIL